MVEIIAECGINHNGSMWLAKELIQEAKWNGADVAKFQIYDVDKIFKPDFEWYRFCKHAQLSEEQVIYLMDVCDDLGIEFMASVFDADLVDLTEKWGMKRYKIASRSVYDSQLLNAIGNTNKDVIVSLGMVDINKPEIVIKTNGAVDYLYCVSKYPTMPEEINWHEFQHVNYSGFSDHTIGIETAKKAIDLGTKIIEKHFTLDKNMYGPDHAGSMEPDELKELVEYARRK